MGNLVKDKDIQMTSQRFLSYQKHNESGRRFPLNPFKTFIILLTLNQKGVAEAKIVEKEVIFNARFDQSWSNENKTVNYNV